MVSRDPQHGHSVAPWRASGSRSGHSTWARMMGALYHVETPEASTEGEVGHARKVRHDPWRCQHVRRTVPSRDATHAER